MAGPKVSIIKRFHCITAVIGTLSKHTVCVITVLLNPVMHTQLVFKYQEYIIKEKRVSNFAIANIECIRRVT